MYKIVILDMIIYELKGMYMIVVLDLIIYELKGKYNDCSLGLDNL